MDSKRKIASTIWPPLLAIVILFVSWELIVRFGLVFEWLIPSPISVFQEIIEGWSRLSMHLQATLKLALIGLILGSLTGIGLAVVFHFIPILRRALYPLVILSQNIPTIVIYPILTMLLGFNFLPKVLLIISVCFFPTCMGMLGGLTEADSKLKNYMHMIGAKRMHIFRHIELPASISGLFSGLKIAASYSVMSAVVAEYINPTVGLGGYLIISSKGYMPERVFAALFFIVALSIILFWLIGWLESYLLKWKPKKEAVKDAEH